MTVPARSEVVDRWWFVSDLHLDPHGGDPVRVGAAFSTLVNRVVLADTCPQRHVVLLGDTFELGGGSRVVGDRTAPDRLKDLAVSSPSFFAGVEKCLDEGIHVHVVCGNHDVQLMSPDATETLNRLVCGLDLRRRTFLTVHPWILHAPGLFYAEHGNQHHALNRMPTVLHGQQESSWCVPRTAIDAWTGEPGMSAFRRAVDVLRAVLNARKAERAASSAEYVALMGRVGEWASLDPELMPAIHRVSRFRIPNTMVRTAGRVLGRWLGTSNHDGYLRAAAARIDRILAPLGGLACYVFGHTHQARLEQLSGTAWYANTGTWSTSTRGRPQNLAQFPYVVVSAQSPQAAVELCHLTIPTFSSAATPLSVNDL